MIIIYPCLQEVKINKLKTFKELYLYYLFIHILDGSNFENLRNATLNKCQKRGTDITKTTIMPPYLRK